MLAQESLSTFLNTSISPAQLVRNICVTANVYLHIIKVE